MTKQIPTISVGICFLYFTANDFCHLCAEDLSIIVVNEAEAVSVIFGVMG